MYKSFQSDNISTRWWTPATTEKWAVSSGGEHCLDTAGVTSSNLVSPTIEFRRIPFGILFYFLQTYSRVIDKKWVIGQKYVRALSIIKAAYSSGFIIHARQAGSPSPAMQHWIKIRSNKTSCGAKGNLSRYAPRNPNSYTHAEASCAKEPKQGLSEHLSAFPFPWSVKRYLNAPRDPLKPRTRNFGIPSRAQKPNTTEAQQST